MSGRSIVREAKRQGRAALEGINYEYQRGARYTVPVDVAVEELLRIARRDGAISAKTVVEESTGEEAPLHPVFTWDDERAANLHRENEARHLMAHIVVTHRNEEGQLTTPPVRGFVAVPKPVASDDDGQGSPPRSNVYIPVVNIRSEEDIKAERLRRAVSELQSFRARYFDVRQLRAVFEEIDNLTTLYMSMEGSGDAE